MTALPPRRRPRYRGTHPRRFEERYKELSRDRYPETTQKLLDAGRTPAGSHRPILVAEILEILSPRPGEIAVDATLGWGGHAEAVLPRLLPGGRLIGLDVDPIELPRAEARLRALGWGPDVFLARRSSFAGLPGILAEEAPGGADLFLADLGLSSMQIDDPTRGFSFKRDGPLDLRMNPRRGRSAAALLSAVSREQLASLLREHSDEPHAERIAEAIVRARAEGEIATTGRLVAVINDALADLPKRERDEDGDRPLARVFQALRIEVNDELVALDRLLEALPAAMKPGGRVAFLTFHSGEDRRVKRALRDGEARGTWSSVTKEVVRAGPEERRTNPRSTSAKLRWAIRSKMTANGAGTS